MSTISTSIASIMYMSVFCDVALASVLALDCKYPLHALQGIQDIVLVLLHPDILLLAIPIIFVLFLVVLLAVYDVVGVVLAVYDVVGVELAVDDVVGVELAVAVAVGAWKAYDVGSPSRWSPSRWSPTGCSV
jgi:hypothetical protein